MPAKGTSRRWGSQGVASTTLKTEARMIERQGGAGQDRAREHYLEPQAPYQRCRNPGSRRISGRDRHRTRRHDPALHRARDRRHSCRRAPAVLPGHAPRADRPLHRRRGRHPPHRREPSRPVGAGIRPPPTDRHDGLPGRPRDRDSGPLHDPRRGSRTHPAREDTGELRHHPTEPFQRHHSRLRRRTAAARQVSAGGPLTRVRGPAHGAHLARDRPGQSRLRRRARRPHLRGQRRDAGERPDAAVRDLR